MSTDNRFKYINSQIAKLKSYDSIDSIFYNAEGFEGGIYLNRARSLFIIFATIIIILYILDE